MFNKTDLFSDECGDGPEGRVVVTVVTVVTLETRYAKYQQI